MAPGEAADGMERTISFKEFSSSFGANNTSVYTKTPRATKGAPNHVTLSPFQLATLRMRPMLEKPPEA